MDAALRTAARTKELNDMSLVLASTDTLKASSADGRESPCRHHSPDIVITSAENLIIDKICPEATATSASPEAVQPGDVVLELGPAAVGAGADRKETTTTRSQHMYEVDVDSISAATHSESHSADDVALGPRQSRSRTRVVAATTGSQADDVTTATAPDDDGGDVKQPKPPSGQATKNARVSSKARYQ